MTIQMIMLQEESLQLNLKSFKIVNNFLKKTRIYSSDPKKMFYIYIIIIKTKTEYGNIKNLYSVLRKLL